MCVCSWAKLISELVVRDVDRRGVPAGSGDVELRFEWFLCTLHVPWNRIETVSVCCGEDGW